MWGQVPAEAKCVRFSGATVKTVKQYACWEPNSCPLNEQEVLWTTKHSSGLWFRTVNYWAFFQPVISLFRLYSLLYIFFSLNFFLRCWKSNSESLTCHTNALIHNGATNPGNGFLFLLERGSFVQPKLVSDSWAQMIFHPQPPTEYCRCVPPHPAFRKWILLAKDRENTVIFLLQ